MTNKCGKCNKLKPITDFHRCNRNKSGYRNTCKECRGKREFRRDYYKPSPKLTSPTGARLNALFKQGLKECSVCKEVSDISNFYRKNKSDNYNGYHAWCNNCRLHRAKEWRDNHKLDIRMYLYDYRITNGCFDCGEKDPRVLEFDHLRDKKFNLSQAIVKGMKEITLKEVKREVRKCVVRCANCHRKKTHKERNSWLNRNYDKLQKVSA